MPPKCRHAPYQVVVEGIKRPRGLFNIKVELGDPKGVRFEPLEALVDTHAFYTVMPTAVLTRSELNRPSGKYSSCPTAAWSTTISERPGSG